MADFDIASKHLMQHYSGDFARFVLGRDDVEDVEVLNPGQRTVKARQADSLLQVQLGGEKVLVHTEFQTTDSTFLPFSSRRVSWT